VSPTRNIPVKIEEVLLERLDLIGLLPQCCLRLLECCGGKGSGNQVECRCQMLIERTLLQHGLFRGEGDDAILQPFPTDAIHQIAHYTAGAAARSDLGNVLFEFTGHLRVFEGALEVLHVLIVLLLLGPSRQATVPPCS
jgi:hypothetical protein